MPDYTGNRNDVVARGINELTRNTPIRQTIPGSKARSILETQGQEVQNAGRLQTLNVEKAYLPTTYGQFLQHRAVTAGKGRRPGSTAEVLAEDRAIKFYSRLGGTFGSINGGDGFTIPAGTIITAPEEIAAEALSIFSDIETPDSVHNRSIHYSTTAAVYCAADATEAWVPAKALTPGTGGNLAAPNMLVRHSFVSYSDHLGDSLRVTNTKSILNGSSAESEASLKYRVSRAITSGEAANDTAIREAVTGIPGVADVVIIPFEDGPGRFNVYVKTISSIVSEKTLADVQFAMDTKVATGAIGYARAPYEVGVELSSTVLFSEKVKSEIKVQILRQMEATAAAYVNSLDLGETLSLAALAEQLRRVDGRISAVGSNRTTFFDAVFVYYPARLQAGGKRREKLIQSSITIPTHARIIAETSIGDPVRFG